ncbi:hypothetical protein Dimus_005066 [Dionaea muscipula]
MQDSKRKMDVGSWVSNVMEVIKRREMGESVQKKRAGVAIEFDQLKSASTLSIPRNNGIYEYIKDVWEESEYTKPFELTRRFANDETLTTTKKSKIW